MKECLLFCVAILFVIFIVDVLCPFKKMNKIVLVFINSMVVLVALTFVISKLHKIDNINFGFDSGKEEESLASLSELETKYLENIIKEKLISENINCESIKINSSFDSQSGKYVYSKVLVFVIGENYSAQDITSIVTKIVNTEVQVYGR